MAYEKNERREGTKRTRRKDDDRPYAEHKDRTDRPRRRDGDRPYSDRKGRTDRPGRRDDDRSRSDRRPRGSDQGDRRRSFSKDKAPRGDRKFSDSKERRAEGDSGRPRHRDDRGPRGPRVDRDHRSREGRPVCDFKGDNARSREIVHEETVQEEPRKIVLSQDPSKLLYRGIDCQINGNNELALIMFLHGSVLMSEGCENNADRILREVGKGAFQETRAGISPNCTADALVEFDYLCVKRDSDYDRSFFDSEYERESTHAIYRRICLEEVEGDDPVIDVFASRYPDDEKKVMRGLDLLRRKKGSESAERHLARIEDSIQRKQSVYTLFTRAMNGDARAVQELKQCSKDVPEAAFFSEYLAARAEGTNVEWLRTKYPQYKDLLIAKQGEFKIQDTPFGMFLKAKSMEAKKEEWISTMMNAARAGSPEAIQELSTKMYRNDVRKCLAGIYLKDGDLTSLIGVYQAGLDDMYYIEQYCGDDKERVLEVGRELGKQSVSKEIDWLKDHYRKGMDFCRDALVEKSRDEAYHCKAMIYALHDVGCDMEAARLYFEMEGSPEIPSVKWLKKVCSDDEVTEYVRQHYEASGDTKTFEFIMAEDDYERRPRKQSPRGPKPRGKPRKRF